MSGLRVYVAGASREIARAEAVIAALREAGVEVTHDWTKTRRAQPGDDSTLDPQVALQIATDCVSGIMNAEALLVLVPDESTHGVLVELGVAWERGLTIHAARSPSGRGPLEALGIFGTLVDEVFDTSTHAVVALGRRARERGL
jgi:hypothetical protein